MGIAEKQKNGHANEKQHRQQQKQNMESKSNKLSIEFSFYQSPRLHDEP
jgi:hypothetical protein